MDRQNIVQSLNRAVEGFIYVLRTQRNMRLHFLLATLVIILGIYFDLPKIELLMLLGAIVFVLVLEMINTAIEYVTDLVTEEYRILAKHIKTISAGAVLVSSIIAVIIGLIIFIPYFMDYF